MRVEWRRLPNIQSMNSDRDRNRNQIYALRQKIFGSYVPNMGTEIQSRQFVLIGGQYR